MSHYLKKRMLSVAAPLLSGAQLHRLFRPFCAGLGQILTLHRVVPQQSAHRIHNHQSLEITPEQLEATIRFYRQQGYRFVSLDEVHDILKMGKVGEKFVAFTFDDGYRDNFTNAYPLLQAYDIPFAIYVTTNFPDRKAILWWYLLEDLVRQQSLIIFEWKGKTYQFESDSTEQKESAFQQTRDFIIQQFTIESHLHLLENIFQLPADQLYQTANDQTLSWEEIKLMNANPLVTIGAHTVHHFPLIRLEEQMLRDEILLSKTKIESQTGQPVHHFAYPFGKAVEASQREFKIVKELGFKTATTTRMGNIFPQHSKFLECLPRISLNRNSTEQVLLLQNSGLLPFLYHKGKTFITH